MRKYKLFIGYRLLGEFSGIWEAKNFAAESGMSGIFSLVGENYRDSWYEPKQDKNGNKDYRHHGSGNNRYRLKRGGTPMPGVPRKSLPDALGAYRGGKTMPTCCGNCSPCKGGNGNTAGNGRENTTRKKSDDNNRPIFLFPVNRPPYGRPASRAVHARYVRQCHGEKFQRLNPTRHACICTS